MQNKLEEAANHIMVRFYQKFGSTPSTYYIKMFEFLIQTIHSL